MLLTIYSFLVFLYWLFLTGWLIINGQRIKYLSSIENILPQDAPSVAIIIAARNEEKDVEQALRSVCELDYPAYSVLLVNDRSTDGTADILTALQAQYTNLELITIRELPGGWLGKNHALYSGSLETNAAYLLFTDADVVFKKDALQKAMHYLLQNNLDHLTILPGIISRSSFLSTVIATFVIMLTAVQRPWAARNRKSKASIGLGAFNLVKKEAYLLAGTHKAIAMRPDDDLKLAAAIKATGGKPDVLYGIGSISVEWYSSVGAFIDGLMKNIFSGFEYNIFLAAGGFAGTLLFFVLPVPLLLIFGSLTEQMLLLGIIACQLILYGNLPGAEGKYRYALLSGYAGLIICYIIARATITNLYQGGIYWRGTFYSLEELRKNK
jgi:glycosyltransferase involved in cell wall biosynthesis